jgi:hypothetical protein
MAFAQFCHVRSDAHTTHDPPRPRSNQTACRKAPQRLCSSSQVLVESHAIGKARSQPLSGNLDRPVCWEPCCVACTSTFLEFCHFFEGSMPRYKSEEIVELGGPTPHVKHRADNSTISRVPLQFHLPVSVTAQSAFATSHALVHRDRTRRITSRSSPIILSWHLLVLGQGNDPWVLLDLLSTQLYRRSRIGGRTLCHHVVLAV